MFHIDALLQAERARLAVVESPLVRRTLGEFDVHRMGAFPCLLIVARKHAQLRRRVRCRLYTGVGARCSACVIVRWIDGAPNRLRSRRCAGNQTRRHRWRDNRRGCRKRQMNQKSLPCPAHDHKPNGRPSRFPQLQL